MISGDYTTSFNNFVAQEVPTGTTCLDIGCWTGNLGKYLVKNKKCTVDGVDFRPDVLKIAKASGYRKTYQIDLNSNYKDLENISEKYQVIIFADVLEHLIEPERILEISRKKLASGGIIIVSLPNVAFFLNRLQLLCGQWNYREFGTLDKTHLKFFTIKTGVNLIKSKGYNVQKVMPYNQFGLLRYLNPINFVFPSLLAYQFLIVAKK